MKKNLLRRIVVFLFILFAWKNSDAGVFRGAELSYNYVSPGQYLVTYKIYLDCYATPAATEFGVISSFTCGLGPTAFTLSFDPLSYKIIDPFCPGGTGVCIGGQFPGIATCTYSATVAVPQACPDWKFSISDCCLDQNLTTIQFPDGDGVYVEAYLNNSIDDNSSAIASVLPPDFPCPTAGFTYFPGYIDPDGDSLAFAFVTPLVNENIPVLYNPGYSVTHPFTSSPLVTIDPFTGSINMNPTVTTEIAYMAVQVQEFRFGVLMGTSMREWEIHLQPACITGPSFCSILPPVTIPICAGTEFCMDFGSCIADPSDSMTMTWNAGIPGATFTASDNYRPVGHFCWTPLLTDVRPQPYAFSVTVYNSACFHGSATQATTLLVEVCNLVNAGASETGLRVFPNPILNSFSLQGEKFTGKISQMQIRNLPGEIVWEKNLEEERMPQTEFDIHELPVGTYFLTLLSDQGKFNFQLVKIVDN